MNEFLRKFDTIKFVAPWSIFRIFLRIFHFFKFKFKSWIWAGSVWLVTGQRFGEPWLDLKKKSNSSDSKVFRDRSSKHSYGTSTTFMAYACVPEASDNVASVLFWLCLVPKNFPPNSKLSITSPSHQNIKYSKWLMHGVLNVVK